MNHIAVNKAIIFGSKLPFGKKDKSFYEYLLFNNVAYYYAKYLSEKGGVIEKKIIRRGDALNAKFVKALTLIARICKKNELEFVLFKTYKHIPEVVDGDIDLFVKKKDFHAFLRLLRKQGFVCNQSKGLKAECTKTGFCKVEPRVDISFYKISILKEKDVWQNTEKVKIGNLTVLKSSRELDVLALLLNILFGPNYCKLYLYKVFRQTDKKKLMSLVQSERLKDDLSFLMSWLTGDGVLEKRFPIFSDTNPFVKWWFKRVLLNPIFNRTEKIRTLAFFFYAKYGYQLFNRLPFYHDWGIKYDS